MSPINRLSCVHLRTPSLEASVDFYSRCFGLSVRAHSADAVALAGTGELRHTLVLSHGVRPGLAGLEFETDTDEALRGLSSTVQDCVIADPLPFRDRASVALSDPDGLTLRLRVADRSRQLPAKALQDGPEYLSHLVINSPDPARLVAFYVERLGFTVSDAYERELLTFLRCNQPQHHCVGIAPGDTSGLNHFAVDCGDIDALMRSVGRMKQAGYEPIWGPGRHGPGGNVFCYFADPTGLVAEFTCDVLQIAENEAWSPRVWDRTPLNGNVWGTGGPSPEAVALMAGHLPNPQQASPL